MSDSVVRESSLVKPVGKRRFSKAEKAEIVAEYAAASTVTGRGEVLRRWETYQQNVSRWTKEAKAVNGGKKPAVSAAKLAKQLDAAEAKLVKATDRVALLEELVSAQGKVLGLHAKNAGSPPRG